MGGQLPRRKINFQPSRAWNQAWPHRFVCFMERQSAESAQARVEGREQPGGAFGSPRFLRNISPLAIYAFGCVMIVLAALCVVSCLEMIVSS